MGAGSAGRTRGARQRRCIRRTDGDARRRTGPRGETAGRWIDAGHIRHHLALSKLETARHRRRRRTLVRQPFPPARRRWRITSPATSNAWPARRASGATRGTIRRCRSGSSTAPCSTPRSSPPAPAIALPMADSTAGRASGCCPGTCTHVWHYAHSVARLFPELERILRQRVDFGLALREDGSIRFRGEANKHARRRRPGRLDPSSLPRTPDDERRCVPSGTTGRTSRKPCNT